jgi:hypothetical protein
MRMKEQFFLISILIASVFIDITIADAIYFDDGGSYLISNDIYQEDVIYLDAIIAENQGTSLQLIDDGVVFEINSFDNSTVNVNGGTIGINSTNVGPWGRGRLASFENSVISVNGGVLYGDLVAYDNGIIYLYGNDFNIGGVDLSYGEGIRDYGTSQEYWGTDALTGTITGILLDGTPLSTVFRISETDINADVIIVPEPTTLSLLAFGVMISKRKKL